jgi:hypothetical protein
LGGADDVRKRSLEFEEKGPMPTAGFVERLTSTMNEARAA